MRIGTGYDAHRLKEGRKLILGGVEIPHEKGLDGHSDADVLLHAVIDAILGAAAIGNIGLLFPDSDERFRNASSVLLLKQAVAKLQEEKYRVVNIDSTIVAQRPKLQAHLYEMREKIAQCCGIPVAAVSVKAKTEESMGFTGSEEGISAQAVCLIE